MVGTGMGAKAGILIRNAEVLERARALKTLVVDKTGTLTRGRPEVTDLLPAPGTIGDALLALAAALESGSGHPLAKAVLKRAAGAGVSVPVVEGFEAVPGKGVRGVVEGHPAVLGSPAWLAEQGVRASAALEAAAQVVQGHGRTVVGVASDGILLGYLAIADQLRDTSREAVRQLDALGVVTVMMTGDNPHTAQAIAHEAGITR